MIEIHRTLQRQFMKSQVTQAHFHELDSIQEKKGK